MRSSTLILLRHQQAGNGKQVIRTQVVERDSEQRVVIHPLGRAEESRMQRGLAPGDTATAIEDSAGRELDGDQDAQPGLKPERCAAAQTSDSNICAKREWGNWLSVEGIDAETSAQRDTLACA
jgi:hypothetical protein